MRVLIMTDMEGVSGIVVWDQVTGGKPMYEECRRLYTEEINAAVRGAKAAGAKEIVVMDCHGAGGEWTFNSLMPDKLDPDCEFVVQNDWTEYTEFLEQGVDAALFVGMHAKVGTPDGVMAHTVSGQAWRDLKFNGTSVGETGINAALCGQWNCPVLLVTGDEAVCRESRELLGEGLTTVAVKKGIGQFSARQFPAQKARELIEEGAKKALQDLGAVKPYNPCRPCEIEVQFHTPQSFEAKQRTHDAYEKVMDPRTPSAEKDRLRQYQRDVSAMVEIPPGALDIQDYNRRGRR
jgi:D-amino peptidase